MNIAVKRCWGYGVMSYRAWPGIFFYWWQS